VLRQHKLGEADRIDVHAILYVEWDSQKGIVIGKAARG
jgi:GTPase Era involved in 16S rRNA processing